MTQKGSGGPLTLLKYYTAHQKTYAAGNKVGYKLTGIGLLEFNKAARY